MELLSHLLNDTVFPGLHLAIGDIGEHHPEDILTSTEQQRCSAFRNEHRKQEFISTRFLVRELSDHAGLNSSIEIQKDKLGKPFGIYKDKHLFISIAHTDTKILCALSEKTDIGIDLEPARRSVNRRLRERILHPEEEKSLEHIESIRLWTIKEAVVKLLGSGLRTNLNELVISHEEEALFLAIFNDEKTARICSFQYQDYWISVAYFV